jgi:eukaryotic-like serine/threonine-protein kinase
MIGKTLGHYEISAQLGKGGMGEVYRARDTILNRDVALKVLPAEFANDAERMARFKREAQLLASLNHPNIAGIYGLEESGGVRALVMELAEGPTLQERILKGPIPLDEALGIARQIAEALEGAHEKGIIHRDLKPANIKITPEGNVKVLDFGLAKASEGEATVANSSESPTLSLAATQAGVILGTAAYMSHEQARGSAVDKRCDIWSFGVVLFEMLTGKQLFAGETVSDTLAAVLRADIDWNLLPANTPASIRTLLRRCLAKDRKQRLRDIGDARLLIEEYISNPSGTSFQETESIASGRKISGPPQITCFYCELPPGQQFSLHLQPFIAVSHDGRKFAFTTNTGLYLRKLNEQEARLIQGTADEAPMQPCFSPDDKQVGYWSQRDKLLKKISIEGGEPGKITDHLPTGGLVWESDNTILYGRQTGDIIQVSADGAALNRIIRSKNKIEQFYQPRFLKKGAFILFTYGPPPYKNAVQSLKSDKRKILCEGGDAQYLSTGHLIYAEGDSLWAVPFDEDKLEKVGNPIPVVPDVFHVQFGAWQYAISSSGTLIYVPQRAKSGTSSNRTLVWVDRNGNEKEIAEPADYRSPRISPDGKKVALNYKYREGNQYVSILELVGGASPSRLTFNPGVDWCPVWSFQGERIFFYGWGKDRHGIFSKAADGAGKEKPLREGSIMPGCLSPDGKSLIAQKAHGESGRSFHIGALSLEGERKWQPLLRE